MNKIPPIVPTAVCEFRKGFTKEFYRVSGSFPLMIVHEIRTIEREAMTNDRFLDTKGGEIPDKVDAGRHRLRSFFCTQVRS